MDRYLDLVRETARMLGMEFFLDCGEGRDYGKLTDEWYVEDLSGWLIDNAHIDRFRLHWNQGGRRAIWAAGEWEDFHCFVRWELVAAPPQGSPPVTVRFERGA